MQGGVERILAGVTGPVAWGVCVRRDGVVVAEVAPDRVLPTASIGKVLLLLEVARRIEAGTLDPRQRLAVHPDDLVADSGLWQHLSESDLAVESLAVLVASVSDNLATNVLLSHVELDAVAAVTGDCGLTHTRLLDRIRDVRGSQHPPAPSMGCATELASLMAALSEGRAVSPGASARVAGWLALGVDTSMVAGGLGLDPLAHADGPIRLFHKTGWDVGVRADAGHVCGPGGDVDYAVLAECDPATTDASTEVIAAMRGIGQLIGEVVR